MRTTGLALAVTLTTLSTAGGARATGAPAPKGTSSTATTTTDAIDRVLQAEGKVTIIPGRALIKVRGIDDAAELHFTKATSDVGQMLAAIGTRQDLSLRFVRASLFGWAVVDVADANDLGAVPTEKTTRAFIDRLRSDDAVDLVAEETWMRPLRTPNDPGLAQQWHYDQIGAKAAWDITVGTSSQRIGVVDTGLVRANPEFAGRVAGGFDFVASANAGNDGDGRDSDFNDAGDDCGGSGNSFHGTHVAGTMGAATNNGAGVAGLNWNAGLVIARALGRCGGSSVDIMEGAAWLAGAHINGVPDVGANKVSVINLSLGSANRCSAYEQQMVNFVTSSGTIMVIAAGNDGGAVGSPASCNGAIAVGAVGPTNQKTSYSSFGPEIAIVAPGGDTRFQGGGILSTLGTGTGFLQGTSMASPHVAGAVSLVQALRPGITRNELVTLLQQTGAACGGCQGKPAMRIGAALAALGAPPPAATPPPATTTPPPASGDDQWEDNDTAAVATRASCGINESRLIAGAGDQDWFVFTPPAGQRVSIDLDGGAVDLDLYVVDNGGTNILARSEGGTGVERISGNASGAALRVLVNPYVDQQRGISHTGPYRLTIRCGASASTQSVGDTDVFVGGTFDDPIIDAPTDLLLDDPVDPVGDVGDVGDGTEVDGIHADTGGDLGDITVSGGCSSGGHPMGAIAGVALLALLRRRRRLPA